VNRNIAFQPHISERCYKRVGELWYRIRRDVAFSQDSDSSSYEMRWKVSRVGYKRWLDWWVDGWMGCDLGSKMDGLCRLENKYSHSQRQSGRFATTKCRQLLKTFVVLFSSFFAPSRL
jgi:hypothetical protein